MITQSEKSHGVIPAMHQHPQQSRAIHGSKLMLFGWDQQGIVYYDAAPT